MKTKVENCHAITFRTCAL